MGPALCVCAGLEVCYSLRELNFITNMPRIGCLYSADIDFGVRVCASSSSASFRILSFPIFLSAYSECVFFRQNQLRNPNPNPKKLKKNRLSEYFRLEDGADSESPMRRAAPTVWTSLAEAAGLLFDLFV